MGSVTYSSTLFPHTPVGNFSGLYVSSSPVVSKGMWGLIRRPVYVLDPPVCPNEQTHPWTDGCPWGVSHRNRRSRDVVDRPRRHRVEAPWAVGGSSVGPSSLLVLTQVKSRTKVHGFSILRVDGDIILFYYHLCKVFLQKVR